MRNPSEEVIHEPELTCWVMVTLGDVLKFSSVPFLLTSVCAVSTGITQDQSCFATTLDPA